MSDKTTSAPDTAVNLSDLLGPVLDGNLDAIKEHMPNGYGERPGDLIDTLNERVYSAISAALITRDIGGAALSAAVGIWTELRARGERIARGEPAPVKAPQVNTPTAKNLEVN